MPTVNLASTGAVCRLASMLGVEALVLGLHDRELDSIHVLAGTTAEQESDRVVRSLMLEAAVTGDAVTAGEWAAMPLEDAGDLQVLIAIPREASLTTLGVLIQSDYSLASALWSACVAALTSPRSSEQPQSKALNLLRELGRQLAWLDSEEEVLKTAADVTSSFLGADGVYAFTSDHEVLWGKVAADPGENERFHQINIPLNSHTALSHMYATGLPVTLTGSALAELADSWPVLRNAGSLHLAPLTATTGCLGALAITGARDRQLTAGERDFLGMLGAHIAIAIEKIRIASWAAEEYSRAQEKSDEFESFLYAASHDLKAPLVSLQAFAQLLKAEYGSVNGEALHYIQRIETNARRMHRLVRDLLEYARAGELDEARSRVDAETLAGEVVTEMADTIKTQNGSVKVAKGLPTLHGDPTRLREVFQNLLENALIYGGPQPEIEIGGCSEGAHARLWVQDNGPGIPADWRDRVFKPCVRDPRAKEENPEGTGMGLAIVKKIVEWHSGEIWIESGRGQGAVFYMTLPLYSEEVT